MKLREILWALPIDVNGRLHQDIKKTECLGVSNMALASAFHPPLTVAEIQS